MKFTVRSDLKLSTDSSASISSEGFLGGKYISIDVGGAEEILKNGGEIIHTQSSINLEKLIGKAIFSTDDKKK